VVAVLTTSWNLLAGAPSHVVEEVKQALGGDGDDMNYPQSALEVCISCLSYNYCAYQVHQMAISTKAKAFLSSPVSQKVINDIYSGNVVFSMTANRSLLADNYKPRAIELYDYRAGPFLNHYRYLSSCAWVCVCHTQGPSLD
jgi:hypothetical protein